MADMVHQNGPSLKLKLEVQGPARFLPCSLRCPLPQRTIFPGFDIAAVTDSLHTRSALSRWYFGGVAGVGAGSVGTTETAPTR